jgi:plastocyanin
VRRHPLTRRGRWLGGAILSLPLLAGCGPTSPSSSAAAVAVAITTASGETLAFEPAQATVRTSGPIVITFQNRSSLVHNLVFTGPLSAGTRTIVEPGGSAHLLLRSVEPGSYPFACTIHEGMGGSLIVLDDTVSRVDR